MAHSFDERVIALAGIFQACKQVDQIARTGMVDADAFETTLKSITITNPDKAVDVYGSVENLTVGLHSLINGLTSRTEVNTEITRYGMALLHLERKLIKDSEKMSIISKGIEDVGRQLEHFGLTHTAIISHLADIYAQSVSLIQPKIMVNGKDGHLNNMDNANKIRALLLGGMRSTILWRQCGGRRFQLIFNRKKYVERAHALLRENVTIN